MNIYEFLDNNLFLLIVIVVLSLPTMSIIIIMTIRTLVKGIIVFTHGYPPVHCDSLGDIRDDFDYDYEENEK